MKLWTVLVMIFIINVPFGYWRANVKRRSAQWFLAIHIPVVFVVTLRIYSGLGWHLKTMPIMVGSFFFGQLIGGQILKLWKRYVKIPATSCLVMDLIKMTNTYLLRQKQP
ncbi:MAG TPA: hypothetical protein VJL89_07315 [Thermodesulfovibrionia bacterium]|nr:hypothetical protein [Thermodesulfovibrionia bacterium]